MEDRVKPPIRQVDTLPDEAILNEVILNREDGYFYMGLEVKEKNNGCSVEKTRIRD